MSIYLVCERIVNDALILPQETMLYKTDSLMI